MLLSAPCVLSFGAEKGRGREGPRAGVSQWPLWALTSWTPSSLLPGTQMVWSMGAESGCLGAEAMSIGRASSGPGCVLGPGHETAASQTAHSPWSGLQESHGGNGCTMHVTAIATTTIIRPEVGALGLQ